jgi:hypothetical protein
VRNFSKRDTSHGTHQGIVEIVHLFYFPICHKRGLVACFLIVTYLMPIKMLACWKEGLEGNKVELSGIFYPFSSVAHKVGEK